MRLTALLLGMLAVAALSGCAPAGVGAPPRSTAGTSSALATAASAEPTASGGLDAVRYIRGIGKPHKGAEVYLFVAASKKTRAEAERFLADALPSFGDMQTYFVVEPSSHFAGLKPGYWVVVEAYREQPSSANLQLNQRIAADGYVKRATIRCSDPIPIYEDQFND